MIGQQWAWTFRYPGYGGVETPELAIPAGRLVELHVTSLDVNHSFWAYQLGVKADAIPGSDNVAFVRARHPGTFEIRCAGAVRALARAHAQHRRRDDRVPVCGLDPHPAGAVRPGHQGAAAVRARTTSRTL